MLTHHATHPITRHLPRSVQSLCRLTAIAALAMGTSLASHAAGGEALDIELPSMRTPVEAERGTSLVAPTAWQIEVSGASPQPLTRARVRESLAMARLANMVNPGGEMGDTAEVLQAREDFNALQTEVMQAEYRSAALRLQQVQVDALLAQAMDTASVPAPRTAPAAQSGHSQDGVAAPDQATVEVVVVPSNKAFELLLEAGQAQSPEGREGPAGLLAPTPQSPAVILLLVNESKPE